MSEAERWVLLGVAPPRAAWFTELARWSTSGVVPVEFIKCLSTDEVASRLRSGRPHSALLVDGRCVGLDRDLLQQAAATGCAVVVIGVPPERWGDSAASSLPQDFDRAALLAVLQRHARQVDQVAAPQAPRPLPRAASWRGRLVGVTGAGGSGCSTVAMAVAQGLAGDPRRRGQLALADLTLDADLALLHDAREVSPAVQELVEAHRGPAPGPSEIRSMLYTDPRRGYDLLLGLRRHRDWTVLRSQAVAAMVDGLVQAYRVVVAEVDPDLEDEEQTGSADVEERNALALAVAARADVVLVAGRAGVHGTHRLGRTLGHLLDAGVPAHRLQPTVVGASARRRDRAQVAAALAELVPVPAGTAGIPSPLHVPHRAQVERCIHDAVPLPEPIVRPLARAVDAALDRLEPRSRRRPEPVPLSVGSIGSWADAGSASG